MELEQKVAINFALRELNEELAGAIRVFVGFTRAVKNKYGLPSGIQYHKNMQVFAVRVNIGGCGQSHIGTYADDVSALAAWKIAKIAILKSLRKKYPEMPESLYDLLRGLVESVEV